MKEKNINIVNKIGMLLITLSIVAFNLIIGGNEKPLCILPIGIFTGLSFLLLFIKKVYNKERLIKSKIDIAVSIFMATIFLPLIFSTYTSLQGTVEFIIKYIFVYSMYLLARNVVDTHKKVNIIIASTVASSLFIIILGFDMLYGDTFSWLIKFLNLKYNGTTRFFSIFGYANAVSIYMSFCIFLSINRIENSDKKFVKIIYLVYILLASYIIYISYSRTVLIVFIIVLAAYLIRKHIDTFKRNKKKAITICIILLCLLIGFITYIALTMKYSKPTVFEESFKIRKALEKNQQYEFSFDVDVTKEDEYDLSNPQLLVLEVNKYFNETEIGRVTLVSNESNTYKVKVKTTDDLYYIKFFILYRKGKTITINHFYIDGEEYVISHKYVPRVISRLITSFSLNDESILQRMQFYENCFRIAKDSPIIGMGGNAWKNVHRAYEDYNYNIKETHSYFFELLISYGIVGVISFTSILILVFKDRKKEKEENNESFLKKSSIFTGLVFLILYNYIFDFGMSFVVLMLVTFIYIAIMQLDRKEKIDLKLVDTIALCVIDAIFILSVCANASKYAITDTKLKAIFMPYSASAKYEYILKNDNEKELIENLKVLISQEPYYKQNELYKNYWNVIKNIYKTIDEAKLNEYLNFGINIFENAKCENLRDINYVLKRTNIITDAVNIIENIQPNKCEEMISRLKDVLIKEYNENKIYIMDYKRNCETESACKSKMKEYKEILEKANISVD